ncbi:MAG: metallophosphoesterase family protein [Isosphaeraceae bacterium]
MRHGKGLGQPFMDGMMRKVRCCWLLLLGLLAGCQPQTSVDSLPDVSQTLEAAGRRLSGSLSEGRLTTLATHAPELVAVLDARERDVLGRGYLRFQTRVPMVVEVAAPSNAVPFWIDDQGFVAIGTTLTNADTRWSLFRKSFPAGWVGLGVNGLDRTPPAHYVVFLRAPPGQPPLTEGAVTLGKNLPGGWCMVQARTGVSAAGDVCRPFATIPDDLDGSILLQPRHEQRHSTLLASGRVWKTHVPSTAGADQVTISYGSDPAHELAWNWRTEPGALKTAIRILPARFESAENDARQDPDLAGMRIVSGTSTLVRSPNLLNDPVIRRHVATVSDLSPDSTYLYSLSDGSNQGWGPWRTAKTGRCKPGRIEFLYMGDAQTGLQDWGRRLFTAYRRHPGIEFILLAGDLVDRGNERTNWDHFFLRAEEIFERIPVMPCVGNHEYLDQGPRLYRSFFALPRNGPAATEPGLVYHFETGSAFFAVLDSTLAVSDPRAARLQAEWLDAALSGSRAHWKFVMFHHPVYPSHPSRNNPELRRAWVPIFDKHHVDLVLQGHDHAYLRTYPMRGDSPRATAREGTIYVVSVAGDKFYDQVQREYIEVGLTGTPTYQTIEIDDVENRLTYRAWTDAAEIADRLVITKPAVGQRPVVARRELSEVR